MLKSALTISKRSLVSRLMMMLVVIIGFAMPFATSAQVLRGTSMETEDGDHSLEWNDNWSASLIAEDDFSTMVMVEGQIMIYAVMFIHDEELSLSARTVYHSLSGVLINQFDSEPTHSTEWEVGDGAYRGAHLLQLSGIDFVLYLRVDPANDGSGPIMQFAAAPVRAFPVSLDAMQTELIVDGGPVFADDDGDDVLTRLDLGAESSDTDVDAAESEQAPSAPATGTSDRSRPLEDRSRVRRDAHISTEDSSEFTWVSEANNFQVTWTEAWSDMSLTGATIGEFSLSSESGRTVVSFSGRSTTETNRQAFYEEIVTRESRYSGFVDSVITDDRLLIASWTEENELAILEYVFVDDSTVVTIMVTITSGNPARYIDEVLAVELNGEPILRDWDDLWSDD